MLNLGAFGKSVEAVQVELNRPYFQCGRADGKYGPKTKAAVRRLQLAHGIAVDGVFGPVSKKKLAAAGQLTAHFHVRELYSKHSGDLLIIHGHLVALERLRAHFGAPITVMENGGYRDPIQNRKSGGAADSQHLYGLATDIVVKGVKPLEVGRAAIQLGLNGIGFYAGFTHVDSRPKRVTPWKG